MRETSFVDPLGKGGRDLMLLLAPLVVAPALGFSRALLGLEIGTSRREATEPRLNFQLLYDRRYNFQIVFIVPMTPFRKFESW
jgi:hypothetical protein